MNGTVSIRSLLVHTRPGCRDRVAAALRREPACDVYPSANKDVLILVTEHASRDEEATFDGRLASLGGVAGVALVSGFTDAATAADDAVGAA